MPWTMYVFAGLLLLLVGITFVMRLAVLMRWVSKGVDVLLVYSDSPHWKPYFEQELIPRLQHRAAVLNLSAPRRWHGYRKAPFAMKVYRYWKPAYAYNPLAITFVPWWRPKRFKFWQPFKDAKHGKPDGLRRVEEELLRTLGESS